MECIICKDDMLNSLAIIATACGHIYHEDCSKKWFDRQITCPTCRSNCGNLTRKLYPNIIENVPTNCNYVPKKKFDEINSQMQSLQDQNIADKDKIIDMQKKMINTQNQMIDMQKDAINTKIQMIEMQKDAINTKIQLADALQNTVKLKKQMALDLKGIKKLKKIYKKKLQEIKRKNNDEEGTRKVALNDNESDSRATNDESPDSEIDG